MGTCYVELGQMESGVMAFQKAISHDSKNPMYYENLARSLIRQDRIDEVTEVLERAARLGIATGQIHHQLGEIYLSRGENERAIETFRQAVEVDKTNIEHYISLAEILLSQDHIEDAEVLLNEAISIEPEHPDVLNNLAIANTKLQKEEASKYMDRITESRDISSDQYMNMANKWANVEEYDGAIALYERCLQIDPGNYSALTNLATCYAKLEEYESAFTGYKAALEMKPNDPTIIGNLLAMQAAINRSLTSR
jgi:Flp pilus assembly protein TadD